MWPALAWCNVSQIENRVFNLTEFCGYFCFCQDLLSTFSKSESEHSASLWLGFSPGKQQILRLVCPFVIWLKVSGWFQPNIISQKYGLAFPNPIEQVRSLQNVEKSTQIPSEIVNVKGKSTKRVSPPNGNRTGVFKQGTSQLSRTWQAVKTTSLHMKLIDFCLFGCW